MRKKGTVEQMQAITKKIFTKAQISFVRKEFIQYRQLFLLLILAMVCAFKIAFESENNVIRTIGIILLVLNYAQANITERKMKESKHVLKELVELETLYMESNKYR